MGQQERQNGLFGGPASNTADYHSGRSQRHVREMAEIMRPASTSFCPVPQPASPIHGPAGNESGSAHSATRTPRRFDGWTRQAGMAGLTMFILFIAAGMAIPPLLDAVGAYAGMARLVASFGLHGHPGEIAGRLIIMLALLYAAFVLSAWRKAQPITMSIGIAVIAVHQILTGG